MPKKTHVFQLIKSLSKAEKRYFRLFAGSSAESANYLLLFDAMDAQEEYDESAIKRRFAGKAFVKQLHVTKHYLNKLLLKSLRNFHTAATCEAELKDSLRDIEILYTRGLYEQCSAVLDKAIRLAERYDRFSETLELYGWKRKLLLALSDRSVVQAKINAMLDAERYALERLLNLNEYWRLSVNIFDILDSYRRDSKKSPDAFFADYRVLRDEAMAVSLQEQTLYYFIVQTWHFFHQDLAGAEQAARTLLARLEERPERIKEGPHSYITTLNNLIAVALHRKRYDNIPELLAKVRGAAEQYAARSANPGTLKLLCQTRNLELEYYRDTAQFTAGAALGAEVRAFLELHQGAISDDYRLLLAFQLSSMNFMIQNYEQALYWLNEIFRWSTKGAREDILSYSYILRMMLHYELGNINVLKYALDSCRRFLRKKRQLYKFERTLLTFFSRICLSPREKHPALLRKLYRDLFDDYDRETEHQVAAYRNFNDYVNFRHWLEHRLGETRR